jgi:hypothetical protein
VVEDHPEFRCALTQALGEKSHLTLLPACNDLPEGMRPLELVCPDTLIFCWLILACPLAPA